MPDSFSTLATVSLQLILQHLDARSFVATALCSRDTLAAASSPFAMHFLSPITLRITDMCEDRRCTSQSLLRFVDVEFCCHGCPFSEDVLASMQSIPRLRVVDLGFYRHHYGLTPLYELSNLAGIAKLKVGMSLDQLQIEHIAERMPQLHTLHLLHTRQLPPVWSALHRLSNLTCLALTLDHEYDALLPAHHADLAACSKLSHLILIRTNGQAIAGVVQHPGLGSQLTQLELWECGLSIEDPAEWNRGFAAMQLLRTLTLRVCSDTEDCLAAAAGHAPSLEKIAVIPRDDQLVSACPGPWRSDYTVPSIIDVQTALMCRQAFKAGDAALFCIQLQFSRLCRECNTNRLGSARWEMEIDGWRALETKTANALCRFRLLLDGPPAN